ncbi:hypothetical protein HELRODRAFT_180642 [Helobdella robusta]|uniref:Uncharacterized protein n=1 Tax=Helobdella robusta TaxID=6412 RepID=T1FG43_HELRO|nr:hypothetical protein HELRODRAFT_180642 [Helobdella robusta]ESN93774.1 hypothetical protein HELRODRAFT_180642 [Helobdella robusta]
MDDNNLTDRSRSLLETYREWLGLPNLGLSIAIILGVAIVTVIYVIAIMACIAHVKRWRKKSQNSPSLGEHRALTSPSSTTTTVATACNFRSFNTSTNDHNNNNSRHYGLYSTTNHINGGIRRSSAIDGNGFVTVSGDPVVNGKFLKSGGSKSRISFHRKLGGNINAGENVAGANNNSNNIKNYNNNNNHNDNINNNNKILKNYSVVYSSRTGSKTLPAKVASLQDTGSHVMYSGEQLHFTTGYQMAKLDVGRMNVESVGKQSVDSCVCANDWTASNIDNPFESKFCCICAANGKTTDGHLTYNEGLNIVGSNCSIVENPCNMVPDDFSIMQDCRTDNSKKDYSTSDDVKNAAKHRTLDSNLKKKCHKSSSAFSSFSIPPTILPSFFGGSPSFKTAPGSENFPDVTSRNDESFKRDDDDNVNLLK